MSFSHSFGGTGPPAVGAAAPGRAHGAVISTGCRLRRHGKCARETQPGIGNLPAAWYITSRRCQPCRPISHRRRDAAMEVLSVVLLLVAAVSALLGRLPVGGAVAHQLGRGWPSEQPCSTCVTPLFIVEVASSALLLPSRGSRPGRFARALLQRLTGLRAMAAVSAPRLHAVIPTVPNVWERTRKAPCHGCLDTLSTRSSGASGPPGLQGRRRPCGPRRRWRRRSATCWPA